ncbi:AraC family transcriptional regulator [Roseibacillus ishigakijimensis]|uniref:Helix-turn-helix domain-containing protein n=1 Tax=Roseibacillus ishigakijimensis TaxID=454146 RepID=A0A934VL78_9BACT|nr:helix-turn-helix domain-containing protein [Roseibacillus ishigakijimensis]MBK1832595.1 helix-turn-helix domain-containing protein [Roseibacillus ishigakijimensis]
MSGIENELGPLGAVLHQAEGLRLVIKDREHRYLHVNEGWMESVGRSEPAEVLGKTVFDLFPLWRARRYYEEEVTVMEEERTIDTFEELNLVEGGRKQMWRSLKAPRRDSSGQVTGMIIVGMLIDPDLLRQRLTDRRPSLVEWMERHACDTLTMEEMAAELKMSRRKLERYFRDNTGMSPGQYRLRCRLMRAKELLRHSEKSLITIANDCGFHDQSHFTKVFKEQVGEPPGQWRGAKKSGPETAFGKS